MCSRWVCSMVQHRASVHADWTCRVAPVCTYCPASRLFAWGTNQGRSWDGRDRRASARRSKSSSTLGHSWSRLESRTLNVNTRNTWMYRPSCSGVSWLRDNSVIIIGICERVFIKLVVNIRFIFEIRKSLSTLHIHFDQFRSWSCDTCCIKKDEVWLVIWERLCQ